MPSHKYKKTFPDRGFPHFSTLNPKPGFVMPDAQGCKAQLICDWHKYKKESCWILAKAQLICDWHKYKKRIPMTGAGTNEKSQVQISCTSVTCAWHKSLVTCTSEKEVQVTHCLGLPPPPCYEPCGTREDKSTQPHSTTFYLFI